MKTAEEILKLNMDANLEHAYASEESRILSAMEEYALQFNKEIDKHVIKDDLIQIIQNSSEQLYLSGSCGELGESILAVPSDCFSLLADKIIMLLLGNAIPDTVSNFNVWLKANLIKKWEAESGNTYYITTQTQIGRTKEELEIMFNEGRFPSIKTEQS